MAAVPTGGSYEEISEPRALVGSTTEAWAK
jgi:hypothetical protein